VSIDVPWLSKRSQLNVSWSKKVLNQGDFVRPQFIGIAALFLISTFSATASESKPLQLTYDFTKNSTEGWSAIFRDVPQGVYNEYIRRLKAGESLGPVGPEVDQNNILKYPEEESHWLMNSGIYPLPKEVSNGAESGFLLQVNNHADDADMWLVKRLGKGDGIKPKTKYRFQMQVQFASSAPEGCLGAGGSPDALELFMGAGVKDPNLFEHSTVTKNIQFAKGILRKEFRTGLNIGNGIPCPEDLSPVPYRLVARKHQVSEVTSDGKGKLWVMVGTHSGYEAFSALYYTRIEVELTPKN
jgi:hypothetical protein